MGIADMLLKTQAPPTPTALTLHQLLQKTLTQPTQKKPYDLESYWMRASKMGYLCPREEVFAHLHMQAEGAPLDTEQPAGLTMTFAHGTATHYMLQNLILGPLGSDVIRGAWKCLECGRQYGGSHLVGDDKKRHASIRARRPTSEDDLAFLLGVNQTQRQTRVPCPRQCECGESVNVSTGSTPFLFIEQWYGDPHTRLCGSPDGFLDVPWRPTIGLLEAKTISPHGVWGIKQAPAVHHVKQSHIYMMLAEVSWAMIVYVEKGTMGLEGLTPHEIERDPLIEMQIREEIATMEGALKAMGEGTIYDKKVCNARSCSRAKDCGFVDQCFGTTTRRRKPAGTP